MREIVHFLIKDSPAIIYCVKHLKWWKEGGGFKQGACKNCCSKKTNNIVMDLGQKNIIAETIL